MRSGLRGVFDARLQTAFTFDDLSDLSQAACALVQSLVERPGEVASIPAPSPDWVAARLWEERPAELDAAAGLRWWGDRWSLLGHPPMSPTAWWNDSNARAWRSAAMDVLSNEAGLVTWERERELIDASLHADGQRKRARAGDYRYPEAPTTLVERFLWLSGRDGHHRVDHWGRAFEFCGDTGGLLRLLCEDLASHDALLREPTVAGLLDLVSERPALLVLLLMYVRQQPVLLADLLLHPATCLLGCLLIAEWSGLPVGYWERSLQDAENSEARERAFEDAVAIAAHAMRLGKRPIEELTQLFVWMHDRVRAEHLQFGVQDARISLRMFEAMRRELLSLSKVQLVSALSALAFKPSDGLGTARFTAALDLVTCANLVAAADQEQLVATYIASFDADDVRRHLVLTPGQAASLALIAQRSEAWTVFLYPIDVPDRLSKSRAADNEYTARDDLARALRAHIRVLSKAIAGWDGAPPAAMVEALAAAIRSGSCDHAEKARLSAFAARFETSVAVSRMVLPLADDIAAACRRLPTDMLRGVEDAVLQVDEPFALAQLLRGAPRLMHEKLSARIAALTPNEAGKVSSLTEVQGRIVCNTSPSTETRRKDLKSHFQKLFGYEQCRFFFHVVYSYVERRHEVLEVMREIAASSAPRAFAFSHVTDLSHDDSRPIGFEATYWVDGGGEAKVFCLVMDMAQQVQRDAAKLAGQTRSERSALAAKKTGSRERTRGGVVRPARSDKKKRRR